MSAPYLSPEGEQAIRALLTPEATADTVRPYATQTRRRAAFHREEAVRLDAIADALYRWVAMQGGGS